MVKLNCPNGIINWLIASGIDWDEMRGLKLFDFFSKKTFAE